MEVARSKKELQEWINPIKNAGKTLGFVPTMGALHAGHQSLILQASAACDVVVLSIYVNPRQFNDVKDFEKYPKTEESDLELAQKAGVDMVYFPQYLELFAEENCVPNFNLMGLDGIMEGASRPGHFKGVIEVVYSLFAHVTPTFAYFGQKDFQQLAIIQRMVSELNLPLEIVACETFRENSGLALSSRNMRLSETQKQEALILIKTLRFVRDEIDKKKELIEILASAKKKFEASPLRLDYLNVVDARTLQPVSKIESMAVICIAAFCDEVRLIDNLLLYPN